MTSAGVLQILLFFALILVCVKPLGAFMANVFEGRRTFLHPVLRWLEVLTYKVSGVQEDVEQRWTQYTASLLAFSIFGFLLVYLLQRARLTCRLIRRISALPTFRQTWPSIRRRAFSPIQIGRLTPANPH